MATDQTIPSLNLIDDAAGSRVESNSLDWEPELEEFDDDDQES